MNKVEILEHLEQTEKMLKANIINTQRKSVIDYVDFVKTISGEKIWTEAFRKAIDENEHIYIPDTGEVYYIDSTVIIPSNRYIEADPNAVIKRSTGTKVLMLRNLNTCDGSFYAESTDNKDQNILIEGGTWDGGCDEFCDNPYNENRDYVGVSACLFFNHANSIYIKDVTVKMQAVLVFSLEILTICCVRTYAL